MSIKRHSGKAVILAFAALTAACASGTDTANAPDWSKSTTYNVTTGRSDRVAIRVLGDVEAGYDYHARIRHTTRSDPDPLDRQRTLQDATKTVIARLCPSGAKQARPSYASNNYEQAGRFVCSVK